MSTSTKTNLVLDLSIFSAFLVASNPRLTGTSIHEWLSISFAAAIITHLLIHWEWIVKIGGEFFKKLFHKSRLNFIVDTLFFVAMTGAIFSGLLISKDILSLVGIQLNAGQIWKSIHSLSADASLIMLGLHFALHWNWLVANTGRYILNPITGMFKQSQPKSLAPQSVRIDQNK